MEERRQKKDILQKFKNKLTKNYERNLPDRIKNRTAVNNLKEIKGEIVDDGHFDPIFCSLETVGRSDIDEVELYSQVHAMMQWNAKSYNGEIEITENLIPDGKQTAVNNFNSMANNKSNVTHERNVNNDYNERAVNEYKLDVESILHLVLDVYKSLKDKNNYVDFIFLSIPCVLWLMWLVLPWGVVLGTFVVAVTIKWASNKVETLETPEQHENSNEREVESEKGKEMVMEAFLDNRSKVCGPELLGHIDKLSVVTDASARSRSFVESVREYLPIKQRKPDISYVKENTLDVTLEKGGEVDIKSGYPRQWIMASLEGIGVVCLADTGANSTACTRETVDYIETALGRKLPRLDQRVSCKVFGHKEALQDCEVVVINITVDEDVKTARCPFIVDESKGGVQGLIGTNVMAHFGFHMDIAKGICYITFKEDALANIAGKKDYVYKKLPRLKTVKDVTIMSNEIVQTPVTVEGELPESSSGMYKCRPAIKDSEDMEAEDVIFLKKISDNKLNIIMKNKSELPKKFESGTILGEIMEYYPTILKNRPKVDWQGGIGARREFNVKCLCDLRLDKGSSLIYFTNRFYFSAQERQVANGYYSMKQIENSTGYFIKEGHIIYARPTKNGNYVFHWDFLKKVLTKNIRIIYSFREKITEEQEKFLLKLRNKSINVNIYTIRNDGSCSNCISLSNYDNADLFRDIDCTDIYVLDSGTQINTLHRVKAQSSPLVEMTFGYYANIQMYRSKKGLQIKIHVTNWHKKYHTRRIEIIMGQLLYQLSVLQAPEKITIYTSWFDLSSFESKQIFFALLNSSSWEANPDFKLKKLDSHQSYAPMVIASCGCDMCARIETLKKCPVGDVMLNFKGKVDKDLIAVGSRIKIDKKELEVFETLIEFNEINEKSEEEYLRIFEESADQRSDSPPHVDDLPGWTGHEHIKEKLDNNVFEIPDASEIQQSYHQPVDWRQIITHDQLPKNPQLLEAVSKVLDRFNDMFTSNKAAWRYFNCDPLDCEFTSNEMYVAKSFGMSKEKEFILDQKVMNLLDAGFLYEIMTDDPRYVTCKLQGFLVGHNSESKRNEILKNKHVGGENVARKVDDNVGDLDPNDYRLIVNGKPSNAVIKNPEQYKEHMPDMQTILNKIGAYRSFITLDIAKAYRSIKASEKLQRRFAFKCDTSMLRGRLFSFKSIPDGLSLAPSYISYIITKALLPIRPQMPKNSDCFVFIDDIIVAAENDNDAIEAWILVMGALEKLNVLVAASKLTVLKGEFQFLGWNIWWDTKEQCLRISVPEDRKSCFARMGLPKSLGALQGIYGSAAFVMPAAPGLNVIVSELIDGLKGNIVDGKFELSPIQERAYYKLLHLLDNLADLYALDFRQTIYHLSDACLTGLGSVIYQMTKQKTRQPIAYFSKRFPIQIQTCKSSVFREILALFWSIEHFRKLLKLCKQVIIIVDISSVVSMLRAHIDPTDKQMNRISSAIFAWEFNFMLKQACGYDVVLADTLSRNAGEPVTLTGVPLSQKNTDLDVFFKDYADRLPKEWTTPAGNGIFNFDDLITHTTAELLKDHRISESVRQKRLLGLLDNVNERFHPTILKYLPKDNPLVDMSISKNLVGGGPISIKSIEINMPPLLRPLKDPYVIYDIENKTKTIKELSPPVTNALNIEYIICMQRKEASTARVIKHLLNFKVEDQIPRIRNKFKLLDTRLLVTKKDNKKEYDPENLRIYLGPISALYVAAYFHLCSGHLGRKKLTQAFNINFKCHQASAITKTITEACLACNLYNYPNSINAPEGRHPKIAEYPGHLVYVDIVHLDAKFCEKLNFTVSDIIGCLDAYSGFVWVCGIKDHTSENIAVALRKIFTSGVMPSRLKMDNEAGMFSPKFREELKSWGIQEIIYSTANHSESNARIESWFGRLRRILWLNKVSFRRSNDHDVLQCSITQLNNAPNWSLAKYYKGRVPPSPSSLLYGSPPKYDIIGSYLDKLDAAATIKYHEKYRQILKEYELAQEEAHKNSPPHKYSSGDLIRPGALVFRRNADRKKKKARGLPYFLTEIYEVIRRDHRAVIVKKLFGSTRKKERVNILDVKAIPTCHLINLLPKEVRDVLALPEQGDDLKHAKRVPILLKHRLSPFTGHDLRPRKGRKVPAIKVESVPAIRDPVLTSDEEYEDDDSYYPNYATEFIDIQKDNAVPFDPNTALSEQEIKDHAETEENVVVDDAANEENGNDDGDSGGSGDPDNGNDNDNSAISGDDDEGEDDVGDDNEVENDDVVDKEEQKDEDDDRKDKEEDRKDKEEMSDKDDAEDIDETESKSKKNLAWTDKKSMRYYKINRPVAEIGGSIKGGTKEFGGSSKLKNFEDVISEKTDSEPNPIHASSPISSPVKVTSNPFLQPSPILSKPAKPIIAGEYRVNEGADVGGPSPNASSNETAWAKGLNQILKEESDKSGSSSSSSNKGEDEGVRQLTGKLGKLRTGPVAKRSSRRIAKQVPPKEPDISERPKRQSKRENKGITSKYKDYVLK